MSETKLKHRSGIIFLQKKPTAFKLYMSQLWPCRDKIKVEFWCKQLPCTIVRFVQYLENVPPVDRLVLINQRLEVSVTAKELQVIWTRKELCCHVNFLCNLTLLLVEVPFNLSGFTYVRR